MPKPFSKKKIPLPSPTPFPSSRVWLTLMLLWPRVSPAILSLSVLLLPMTSKAPTVSKVDGTSSTNPTSIRVVAFPTSPSSSQLMMLLERSRTWPTGLVTTERLISRPITTPRFQKTSPATPMAGHSLYVWSSITLAISINHCTLWLRLTQSTHLVTRVAMLSPFQAFAALETYTPFGILSRTTTAATQSL